jgi:hypothetical protein
MQKDKGGELRAEYSRASLGTGVRGKYLKDYRRGTNLVLLTPDVAWAFPSEMAVNDALSSIITVARRTTRQNRRRKK